MARICCCMVRVIWFGDVKFVTLPLMLYVVGSYRGYRPKRCSSYTADCLQLDR